MLNFSAARIYLCLDPTDMRKSFDTLAAMVREHLQGDPLSGTWFVFRGKQGNRLKILYWDRDGYALYMHGLSQNPAQFTAVHWFLHQNAVLGQNFCNRLLAMFHRFPSADIAAAFDLHLLAV